MRRTHCGGLAVEVALLALAALDLRTLARALVYGHRCESRRMLELTLSLRVACAPAGVPRLHELTVSGPAIAFEPGKL